MKTKEKQTLRAMSQAELAREAETIEGKLAQLRISKFSKPSKNTREAGTQRRRLAVVRTIEGEKEMAHEEK